MNTPSANASDRLLMGYFADRLRKRGADGFGLAPVRPIAWQVWQFCTATLRPIASVLFIRVAAEIGVTTACVAVGGVALGSVAVDCMNIRIVKSANIKASFLHPVIALRACLICHRFVPTSRELFTFLRAT